jgi:hypothetical protein
MENIEKRNLLHQAFNFMIAVRAALQYFQKKIDLGRSFQGKDLTLLIWGDLFHELRVRMPKSLAIDARNVFLRKAYIFLSALAT